MWATWCGPCRGEFPVLKAETERLADQGIRLLLVSVDETENQAKIPAILSSYGIEGPYYVVRPPRGEFKRAVHPTWPGNIPVSFLYDSNGKGRFFWDGPVTSKVLRTILDEFLASDPSTDQN